MLNNELNILVRKAYKNNLLSMFFFVIKLLSFDNLGREIV